MKVIILGCQGMLGYDLMSAFGEFNPVGWGRGDLDITKEKEIKEKLFDLKPDLVINAAAYTQVDDCESHQELAMKVNGRAVGYLAETCRKLNIPLVHYSTDYVFEGQRREGYDEDAKPHPINAYGRSKELGEKLLQEKTDKFYLIRTAWLYGKHGKNFVETMLNLAKTKREIAVVSDQVGSPTFTRDLAEVTRQLVEEKKDFGIYHLTNSGSCSWYEFAQKIFELSNLSVKVKPIISDQYPTPARRPSYSILINTKLPPLRSWEEALGEYLESFNS